MMDGGGDTSRPGQPDVPDHAAPEKVSLVGALGLGIAGGILWLGSKLLGIGSGSAGPSSGVNTLGASEAALEKAPRGAGDSRIVHAEPLSHEQIGAFLVTCAFLLGLAGGIAFLVLYWTGGSNRLLGCSMALFCGGLGAALVLWSHLLAVKNEVVAPREQLETPAEERQAAGNDLKIAADQIHRRGLLKWMVAGGMGVFAAMVLSLFRSFGSSPNKALYSKVWRPGQRLMTLEGKPVRADALEPGGMALVFPEDSVGSEKAQTVLIRVDEPLLQLPEDRADWAPEGNLAFSRVCTHAGCAVGMYETTTHLLMCPCHQSTFDVLRAAVPTGGPAARALPQLPLYVDSDGILRAGGGFSDVPGPEFWGMPS